eukprot:354691-Chlamydomonas_euryale.AAC.23
MAQDADVRAREHTALHTRTAAAEAAAARANARIATVGTAMRDMLARTAADALAARESRNAAGGRFQAAGAEAVAAQLADAVDSLVDENKELWQTNVSLEAAKADLTKRVKVDAQTHAAAGGG